jgi:hypothetical protein
MIIVAICKITYFPYLIPDYITKKAPTKAHVGKMWGKIRQAKRLSD